MQLPFSESSTPSQPLAERVRPRTLEEFVGQEAIIGPGTLLRAAIEQRDLRQSLILWGPPGCGKTTLARLIADHVRARFVTFSAVTSGIADVKRVIADARNLRSVEGAPLLMFVDEIHRFNKAQQDAFLPHIEDGTIVFVGATTENPSFEVIPPLLSRSRVLVLEALGAEQIRAVLHRALDDEERGLGRLGARVDDDALAFLAEAAQGDARAALNALEYASTVVARRGGGRTVTREHVEDALQRRMITTDKHGESHYNLISALHKSLRGGDADAGLYWLARMCEAGEDPLFIARRLVVFASEDVGNADPHALVLAIAVRDAVAFNGYPECKLALAQAVIYLALAPKSNAAYTAYKAAARAVREGPPHPVPMHLRNAPTPLMKDLGYGRGYKYPHEFPGAFVAEHYLPEALRGSRFYRPDPSGPEKAFLDRLEAFLDRRDGADGPPPKT